MSRSDLLLSSLCVAVGAAVAWAVLWAAFPNGLGFVWAWMGVH